MNVLVDTSIWSIALRRHKHITPKEKMLIDELTELINEGRANIIGPIRQELLSGIPHEGQFVQLKNYLKSFIDIPIAMSDYEKATELFNHTRKNGVQGSHIDFLICAIAMHHHMSIFTNDKDFYYYSKYLDIFLYELRTPT